MFKLVVRRFSFGYFLFTNGFKLVVRRFSFGYFLFTNGLQCESFYSRAQKFEWVSGWLEEKLAIFQGVWKMCRGSTLLADTGERRPFPHSFLVFRPGQCWHITLLCDNPVINSAGEYFHKIETDGSFVGSSNNTFQRQRSQWQTFQSHIQ